MILFFFGTHARYDLFHKDEGICPGHTEGLYRQDKAFANRRVLLVISWAQETAQRTAQKSDYFGHNGDHHPMCMNRHREVQKPFCSRCHVVNHNI